MTDGDAARDENDRIFRQHVEISRLVGEAGADARVALADNVDASRAAFEAAGRLYPRTAAGTLRSGERRELAEAARASDDTLARVRACLDGTQSLPPRAAGSG